MTNITYPWRAVHMKCLRFCATPCFKRSSRAVLSTALQRTRTHTHINYVNWATFSKTATSWNQYDFMAWLINSHRNGRALCGEGREIWWNREKINFRRLVCMCSLNIEEIIKQIYLWLEPASLRIYMSNTALLCQSTRIGNIASRQSRATCTPKHSR